MPLYDYRCTQCGNLVEVRHGFDETHDAACPSCGGALKRVFNPAPIVFKGSGFYVTDSRAKAAKSDKPAAKAPDAAAAATPSSETATPAKTDAPAATTPAATPPKDSAA